MLFENGIDKLFAVVVRFLVSGTKPCAKETSRHVSRFLPGCRPLWVLWLFRIACWPKQ